MYVVWGVRRCGERLMEQLNGVCGVGSEMVQREGLMEQLNGLESECSSVVERPCF